MPRTISSRRGGFCGRQPTIWEPQGTKFRPYGITTLIFSYSERFFGRWFDRHR